MSKIEEIPVTNILEDLGRQIAGNLAQLRMQHSAKLARERMIEYITEAVRIDRGGI